MKDSLICHLMFVCLKVWWQMWPSVRILSLVSWPSEFCLQIIFLILHYPVQQSLITLVGNKNNKTTKKYCAHWVCVFYSCLQNDHEIIWRFPQVILEKRTNVPHELQYKYRTWQFASFTNLHLKIWLDLGWNLWNSLILDYTKMRELSSRQHQRLKATNAEFMRVYTQSHIHSPNRRPDSMYERTHFIEEFHTHRGIPVSMNIPMRRAPETSVFDFHFVSYHLKPFVLLMNGFLTR